MFRSKRSVAVYVLIFAFCILFVAKLSWRGEKRNDNNDNDNDNDSRNGGGSDGQEEHQQKEDFESSSSPTIVEAKKNLQDDDISSNMKRPTTTTSTTTTIRYEDERTTESYCVWEPGQQVDCKRVLSQRLINKEDGSTRIPRRWLFLGDSTIAQLWRTSSLSRIMVDFALSQIQQDCSRKYDCHSKSLQECHLNEQFELSKPASGEWELPRPGQEGPAKVKANGDDNDHCFGCKNCISNYVACATVDDDNLRHCRKNGKHLSYGGYIAMPYARDVLLQTPQYKTTQENILFQYIQPHWNTLDLMEDFDGKPICVARAGFHDVAIPQLTLQQYVSNVLWYLNLLQQQCSHIIWLQNTAPLLHDNHNQTNADSSGQPPPKFPQTVERIREYNLAVYTALQQQQQQGQANGGESGNSLRDMVTTMDVFEASKTWSHDDNIHLTSDWNRALGMFFVKLSTRK